MGGKRRGKKGGRGKRRGREGQGVGWGLGTKAYRRGGAGRGVL